MNAYLVAATALVAGLLPCLVVCARARPIEGLVALELAGATTTLALLCLAEGFNRTTYFGVAVIAAVLTWAGGLVFARFLGRKP
jgi:multisubunit Na+/H+ antiporter MnhF subunit